MSQLKPYPDFICELCSETATEWLKPPDSCAKFWMVYEDADKTKPYTCERCGKAEPCEETSSLGYPILSGHEPPSWSPEDEDPVYVEGE